MKERIALIVPWFGPFPDWMPLFIHSVKNNPILSYHFWTNQSVPDYCHSVPNVYFHIISFDDYCKQASDILGVEFRPSGPYKMCDLRPFYPIIHKTDIEKYEFIGFADIDLILGNMQEYLEPIIDNIDIFSSHADRISGHFFFIRNKEPFTSKGYKIRNWKKFLSYPINLGIDEGAYCDALCPALGIGRRVWHRLSKNKDFNKSWKLSQKISRFTSLFISSRLHFKELHSTHSAISSNVLEYEWSDSEWIYKNGKIIGKNNGKSYPYLHFLYLKTVKEIPVIPTWQPGFYKVDNIEDPIIISRNKIANT